MERINYDVGKKLEYLLTTGNLVSKSGLDLMQARRCDGLLLLVAALVGGCCAGLAAAAAVLVWLLLLVAVLVGL